MTEQVNATTSELESAMSRQRYVVPRDPSLPPPAEVIAPAPVTQIEVLSGSSATTVLVYTDDDAPVKITLRNTATVKRTRIELDPTDPRRVTVIAY